MKEPSIQQRVLLAIQERPELYEKLKKEKALKAIVNGITAEAAKMELRTRDQVLADLRKEHKGRYLKEILLIDQDINQAMMAAKEVMHQVISERIQALDSTSTEE